MLNDRYYLELHYLSYQKISHENTKSYQLLQNCPVIPLFPLEVHIGTRDEWYCTKAIEGGNAAIYYLCCWISSICDLCQKIIFAHNIPERCQAANIAK